MNDKNADINEGIIAGNVSADVLAVGSEAKAEKNVTIVNRESVSPCSGANRITQILFLASNPTNTNQLRLDEEFRSIDESLQQTVFRDCFKINQHGAVRVDDLQKLLLRHQPHIVHFSGHGAPSSEIVLEDRNGKGFPVSSAALSRMFGILKDNIRCVVLNACFTKQQALAIADHIDCVIGMSKAIGDASAISFSTAFYRALAYGRDIQTAFALGCSQVDIGDLGDQDVPKLLTRNDNSGKIVFV
jgi:CHAT domain-containing protein